MAFNFISGEKMTKEDLDTLEKDLQKYLDFAVSVQASTKNILNQLELVKLAKIGLEVRNENRS